VRIVSLLPSATEIVFAVGRGDDLVGVTFECDHPPEARRRRIVSTSMLPEGLSPAEIDAVVSARVAAGEDLYRLDEGALAELDADVVLTQDLCAVCAVDLDRVDDALTYLGCTARVLTLDPQSLDDVVRSVLDVGDALDAGERAREVVDSLRARLHALGRSLAGAEARSVLVLEWTDPPFCAGQLGPRSGGCGVVAPRSSPSLAATRGGSRGTRSDRRAPRWCLVAPCGYHLEQATAFAEQLVADDRLPVGAEVWAVDADSHFVRPGPRLVDGAETVARVLHPGIVGAPAPDRAQRVDRAATVAPAV